MTPGFYGEDQTLARESWGILLVDSHKRKPWPPRAHAAKISWTFRDRPLNLTWRQAGYNAVDALLIGVYPRDFRIGFGRTPEEVLSEVAKHDRDEFYFVEELKDRPHLFPEGTEPPFMTWELLSTEAMEEAEQDRIRQQAEERRRRQRSRTNQTDEVDMAQFVTCQGMVPPKDWRPPVLPTDESPE